MKPNRVSQAADRHLPSYQEALGHASEGGQTETSPPPTAPPPVAKEHRKWVLAVVQNRLKLSPAEKQALRDRSEKIKDIIVGRLKLSSISHRSSSVTSEVKKQAGNMSLIRGERLGADQWAEAADKAVSVIKSASVAGTEDEQMTQGRMLVCSANAVRTERAVDIAETRHVVNEFKDEPSGPNAVEEAQCKFKLYEAWAEATLSIRSELFTFVESNQAVLDQQSHSNMLKALADIDIAQNMAAPSAVPGVWLVYSMACKVYRNTESMLEVLDSFEDYLAKIKPAVPDSCPVCLQAFGERGTSSGMDILKCCHGICTTCSANIELLHWNSCAPAVKCPLCRHCEFEAVLLNVIGI